MSEARPRATMHIARTAMNNAPAVRAWAESWLKRREREKFLTAEGGTGKEFEKHWRYVRPETMHEGALEAYEAYLSRSDGVS
jgi:hypothetical protein